MKLILALAICLSGSLAAEQKKPPSGGAKTPLAVRLKATEDKLAKIAASEQNAIKQMDKVGANLDAWTKTIHAFRMRLEGR